MTTRFPELDGLRGLAALAVLLNHVGGIALPGRFGPFALWNPVAWITNVSWGVTLFFVLSGFVLALPWTDGRAPDWPVFVLRRACRLWPLVALATLLGTLAWLVTPISFGNDRCTSIDSAIIDHLLLTGATCLDAPVWSLAHEARISLAFPVLVLGVRRQPTLAAIGGVFLLAAWRHDTDTTLTMTAHYAGAFIAGILAARYRCALDCSRWSPVTASAVAIAAVLALRLSADLAQATASAVLILLTLNGWGRTFLCIAPVQWLGRVSYSLYLLHVPVIILAAALPWSRWACTVIALSSVFAISELAYRLVEAPSIMLGRKITCWGVLVPSAP